MFRNEFARGGPILNSAIGAIEIAMWDIVGKALDRPVHELLGGRVHERSPAANAWYGRRRRRRDRAGGARGHGQGLPRPQARPFESSGRDRTMG